MVGNHAAPPGASRQLPQESCFRLGIR
jgi:hypothetical protein